jgi:hypothetical protein
MAIRTISSPGIQINEIDKSIIARPVNFNNTFVCGFANQGPTDEVINIGSLSEFEDVFGIPSNAAERYFYHSCKQMLTQAPANLFVTRVPYGSGAGEGFSNQHSALVYPIKGFKTTSVATLSTYSGSLALSSNGVDSYPVLTGYQTIEIGHEIASSNTSVVYDYSTDTIVTAVTSVVEGTTTFSLSACEKYTVEAPHSVLLNDNEYETVINGGGISWSSSSEYVDASTTPINNFSDIVKYGGLVVLDSSKTTVNNLFEGYYVAIADNSETNPASDFTSINGLKAVTSVAGATQTFNAIPDSRLNFNTTQSYLDSGESLSKVVENFPREYDFGTKSYNDCLTVLLVKVRTSTYANDNLLLDYSITEGYTGSLNKNRKRNSTYGGPAVNFHLDDLAGSSSNLKVVTNPYITDLGIWTDSLGVPAKTVRLSPDAKYAFSKGVYYSNTFKGAKDVGNVPLKLQRVLNNLDNLDVNLDVTAEAGLGTIWTLSKARWEDPNFGNKNPIHPHIFDDAYTISLTSLKEQTGDPVSGAADYLDIANQFAHFAGNTRKDHIFIADPLRNIFIQGADSKNSKSSEYVFSRDIYWPLRNLYGGIQSSYCAVYGNWVKTTDIYSDLELWAPSSGFVAALFATSATSSFPWSAPAGFERGVLTNVTDLAINPTQKQRDILYKMSINPITFFSGDGYVLYGQKTLFNKPSAFDRINVRRLFLFLEKTTKEVLKYFIFEPNTFTTRTRVVNALAPAFNQAKNNDGVYDYKIVCDERNNTPDVIDNNELRLSIYIQPVRTAEFILADFIATRTGIDFNELIG